MVLLRRIRRGGGQTVCQADAALAKPHKFGAKKCLVHGFTFASHAEAARYVQLLRRYEAGEIQSLVPRPLRYDLVVKGVKIGTYRPDFEYIEDTKPVIEDVKGPWTQVARLRIKLFEALYPHFGPVRIVRMEGDMVERLLASAGVGT